MQQQRNERERDDDSAIAALAARLDRQQAALAHLSAEIVELRGRCGDAEAALDALWSALAGTANTQSEALQ